MLDQQHGNFVFQCEACPEILEASTSNFEAAQNVRRRAKWATYKTKKGDWGHLCPDCSQKIAKGRK